MDIFGVALLIVGMAFLFSGLVSLLPTERKLSSRMESFEDNQWRIEYYLSQMRKQSGDL
jgi:hypothetical protein